MNKKELCKLLQISSTAFDNWGIEPVCKVGREVFFELQTVMQNRLNNQLSKQAKNTNQELGEGENLEYERYRLTKAQADAQELKNQIATQKVISTEFALFALVNTASEIASTLDQIPAAVSRKDPQLEQRHLDLIEFEIAKACNIAAALGDKLPDLLNEFQSRAEA